VTFLIDEPQRTLTSSAPLLDAIARELPVANTLGLIDDLIPLLHDLDPDCIPSGAPTMRAFMIVSMLAHSYIWSMPEGRNEIPEILASPWVQLASRCGLPPVLTYSSYVLDNLAPCLVDDETVPAVTFSGSPDEIWFIRVHQLIERAGSGIVTTASRRARKTPDGNDVYLDAETIASSLEAMCVEARRMGELCDPYIYFQRIRRFLYGWKSNPTFGARRMTFCGVASADLPADGQYSGETGAQSPLIPLADELLGVQHSEPFFSYATDMRSYMYPAHRALVATTSQCGLASQAIGTNDARRQYRRALEALREFRSIHLAFANEYIVKQAGGANQQKSMGTGGSHVIAMLSSARHAVEDRLRAV